MLVDVHTHVFDSQLHLSRELKRAMARAGIDPELWAATPDDHLTATEHTDRAVVFGLRAEATGWNIPNEFVADHVKRAPNRLIFFASVDPRADDFMDELRRCHTGLGCRGLKLAPVYQGVHPLDPRYRLIYDYCQRHGLPILFHFGTTFTAGVPLDYARPLHADQIAIDYPELKVIIAHLAHPWETEAIAIVRRHPNLYADVSALFYRPWQFYNSLRLSAEYGVARKLLFGSDFPATTPADSVRAIRAVHELPTGLGLPAIPTELIENILDRNSLELLGLEDLHHDR